MSHRRAKKVRQAFRQAVSKITGKTNKDAKVLLAADREHRQVYQRVKRHAANNPEIRNSLTGR